MRRILLLITDLEIGGTPTVVRELAKRLHDPPQVGVDVACLSSPGPVGRQIQAAGNTVWAFGARGMADFPSAVRRLVELIDREKFDTILSFLIHANTVAAAASMLRSAVRLIQSIQTTQPWPRWHWVLQRIVQARADRVLVPSPSVAKVADEWADVPADRIVIIPNAVDFADFASSRQANAKAIRIGFVGRLDPVKRVETLIAAVAALPVQFHLEIFGDGPQRASLVREAQRQGLENRVTFHGFMDSRLAIATLDVLSLPSIAEGFGLVLIEAMAAGVPVVAANVPGIRDVVQDKFNGLLIDPTDTTHFARAIEAVATNLALRNRLITNGRLVVGRYYSWETVLPQYNRLIEL